MCVHDENYRHIKYSRSEDEEYIQIMKEIAYYYPAPYWRESEGEGIKSLLLFFDEVAILLPDYMYGRHTAADPTLAAPLEEQGLLRVLEPKKWIDSEMTQELAEIILKLLADGVFDGLPQDNYYAELSRSRMGYGADVELAATVTQRLKEKGLARPSEDGVSIPLHPAVRTMFLVILGQLARRAGERRGMILHPATNVSQAAVDIVDAFSRPSMLSCDQVISFDLEPASLDLSTVPLEDVLQLREEHGTAHREYMRSLRGFILELSQMRDQRERESALFRRRQEIADMAHETRKVTRMALGKNLASWSLGITGTAWSVSTGDVLGAALGAAGFASGLIPASQTTAGAYSYLFDVSTAFGRSINW